MTATLALSGRAGEQRLGGRVDAGFTDEGQARLEGRAPFGRPVFVLVAPSVSRATLTPGRGSWPSLRVPHYYLTNSDQSLSSCTAVHGGILVYW